MHSQDRVFATHIQKCMEIDKALYQKLELQPHWIYHHGYCVKKSHSVAHILTGRAA